MAEQPMYAYWDDQTAVSASGAAAPSSSLPPPPHSSSRPQQNFSLDSVNYNNASTGGSAPSQGFVGGQFVAAPAAGQNNQESVRQLQQNLMLMLQQHSEQKAGDQTSQGNNTSQLSHSPQLQSQQQEDFMAQYCQLLGLQQDDGAPEPAPSNSGSTSNSIDNTASPSSSRLFALGAMVEPLPPDKPPHFKTSGKSGTKKQQEISASSLGMSESSSDFMMKLFQSDGGTQQQPSDYSGSFPFQQTSNSSITVSVDAMRHVNRFCKHANILFTSTYRVVEDMLLPHCNSSKRANSNRIRCRALLEAFLCSSNNTNRRTCKNSFDENKSNSSFCNNRCIIPSRKTTFSRNKVLQ
jgi:hypothetical protein